MMDIEINGIKHELIEKKDLDKLFAMLKETEADQDLFDKFLKELK